MIKYDYKTKQIIDKVEDVEYLYCDKCNKLIYKIHLKDRTFCTKLVEWYDVITGHNDWGMDSSESIQQTEICPDCIEEVYNDYIKRAKPYSSEYIEIAHRHGYTEDFTIEDFSMSEF